MNKRTQGQSRPQPPAEPTQPEGTTQEIKLIPNYSAMHEAFKRDALNGVRALAGQEDHDVCDLYAHIIYPLRIALMCATTTKEIVALRDEFDAAADKVFTFVQQVRAKREAEEDSLQA